MKRTTESNAGQTTTANAASRFGKFKPEGERVIREAEQPSKTALKRIIRAWDSITYRSLAGEALPDGERVELDETEVYGACVSVLPGIHATALEVRKFVSALHSMDERNHRHAALDFFKLKAGAFLSALVNSGSEENYLLNLRGLPSLRDLGMYNAKSLEIWGDVGTDCAFGNKGRVEIHGNALGFLAANHKGGETILKGDSHSEAGELMSGGVLRLYGEVGSVGYQMQGGKIYISSINLDGVTDLEFIGQEAEGGEVYILERPERPFMVFGKDDVK